MAEVFASHHGSMTPLASSPRAVDRWPAMHLYVPQLAGVIHQKLHHPV